MKTKIADLIHRTRRAKGLRLSELASMVGYQNTARGAARLDRFEKYGCIREDLLLRVAVALGISHTVELHGHTFRLVKPEAESEPAVPLDQIASALLASVDQERAPLQATG